MYSISSSTKCEETRKIENKLYYLVSRKEAVEKEVDEFGRSLLIDLQKFHYIKRLSFKYRGIMNKANRYLKQNQKYIV